MEQGKEIFLCTLSCSKHQSLAADKKSELTSLHQAGRNSSLEPALKNEKRERLNYYLSSAPKGQCLRSTIEVHKRMHYTQRMAGKQDMGSPEAHNCCSLAMPRKTTALNDVSGSQNSSPFLYLHRICVQGRQWSSHIKHFILYLVHRSLGKRFLAQVTGGFGVPGKPVHDKGPLPVEM